MKQSQKITVVHSVYKWLQQTQTWLYNQVRYLPPNIENHIVCEGTKNLDQFYCSNIHPLTELPRWKYLWDKGIRKLGFRNHLNFLVEWAGRSGATLLHSHFGNAGWRNLGAARLLNLKHIVTFYGYDVSRLPFLDPRWRDRYIELFTDADRILCEGPHLAGCIKNLGCPEEKIRVHHLGICFEKIRFEPRLWKPGEPLKVLIAGTFREKKGFPFALEALGALRKKNPLEITIIGDEDGEDRSRSEKERILTTIKNHNLEPVTRMLGYRPYDTFLEEARRHHIFLSPSVTASDGDSEGGAPVSIIEMCASGIIVVSTKHDDIPNVVRNGVTGLLAKERDVEGLVTHLEWLTGNPDKWYDMMVAARRHVENEFDAKIQGERLGAIYEELDA